MDVMANIESYKREFSMDKYQIRSMTTRAAAVLALLWCFASLVAAQVTTGSLQGVARDPNGAVVAGASVTVTNVSTGIARETTTNDEGFYRVTNLIPGDNYKVEVTSSGFGTATVEPVRVLLATENSVDVALVVTQVGVNVDVTSNSEQLLNTTQNQLSQAYTPRQLTELPFNGSIDNLALLTPGVATPGDADFTNGVGISANGNRARSNNFQIDGQDNNDNSVSGPALGFTNAEAIGEYQVITSNFSAEFGRNSGAQVNVVTRSGTNEFHGALFEFHQNSALNARNNIEKRSAAAYDFLATNGFPQFASLSDRFPNPFRNNRFGGRIGGPLLKNKAFFFVTYQRDVLRGESIADNLGSSTFTPTAASAAFLATRFPNAATGVLNTTGLPGGPATATGGGTLLIAPPTLDTNGDGVPDSFAFPGNPGNLAILAVTNAAPGSTTLVPILGGEGVRIFQNNNVGNQLISRVDYNLTDKDSIIGRFIFDRNSFPIGLAGSGSVAGGRLDYRDRTANFGVTYTRTISASTVNEARYNYSNLSVAFGDTTATTIPNILFSGGTASLAGGLNLNFGTDASFPQSRKVVTNQFQDTVSTTIGNHAVKFGGDIRFQRVNDFFLPFFLGGFTFTGGASGGTLPADTFFEEDGTPRTGLAATQFENFVLGRPRTINFTLGDPNSRKEQNDYFFFVQDDWRVHPTLTLNLGLRYEFSTQPLNKLIDQLNARESDPATALFDPAFPLSSRTAVKIPTDKNNFAPRVGFAWSPNLNFLGERFTNGRTVIRGGFGIAYDPSFFNLVSNTVTSAPFVARGSFVQTPGSATAVSYPFLPTTQAQLNLTPSTGGGDPRLFSRTLVAPDFHNPYTMSFNFGIQQEVFQNSVIEARYVGSRIVGQFQTVNANPNLRYLAIAGQTLFGDPGRFTSGVLPGTCVGATCVTPTAANNFASRTAAAANGNGRLDPNFGFVLQRQNSASSTYHGLQLRFDTRLRNSLALNLNYSLSKTIDNSSEVFATLGGGQTVAISQDPFDITDGERGLSAFHQKHIFNANFIYDLPFFKEQRGFMGKLLGGYQLNGLIRLGSGRPYTPAQAFGRYDQLASSVNSGLRPFNGNPNAPNGTIAFGVSAACAVLFGGPECGAANAVPGNFIIYNTLSPGSLGQVVTPTQALQQARLIYNDFGLFPAFGLGLSPDPGDPDAPFAEAFQLFRSPFGDVGRNTFSGLPTYTVNMAVFKTTKLTEGTSLEFRVEGFNLLNRRNFGVPDAITEDASNGFTVSSFQNPGFNTGDSRSLRFGLRLIF